MPEIHEQEPSLESPTSRKLSRRHFLGAISGAAAALALTGCQQGAAPSPTKAPEGGAAAPTQPAAAAKPAATTAPAASAISKDPIKIGVLEVRAGVAAAVGQAAHRGTEWWADRVNKAGGILGRQIQLVWEEESTPKDTVDRYRKLVLQDKVDVVLGGISTGATLALGPVIEETGTPVLMWDGTTQDSVKETIPQPKWTFRSTDNETEAIGGALMIGKYFKDVKTIAGIGNDYSYGHDCWETFKAALTRLNELGILKNKPEFVLELFPKLGVTEFASHISTIQQAKPDLLMCSFWSGDAPIFLKQASAVGLFKNMKGCFTTAGGMATELKKEFVPEGLILGYNNLYFDDPKGSALLKEFVKDYKAKYNEFPPYETDHAYFVAEAYKAAVEKASKAAGGGWPTAEQVVKALEGIEVETPAGKRSYRKDHIMSCNFFQGITTHKNSYDCVTIDPLEVLPTANIMKPTADTNLHDWIKNWKLGPNGLPVAS